MTLNKSLFLCVLALALILGIETYTDLDIWVQNHFYLPQQREWLINAEKHKQLTYFFYTGLKCFLFICALGCLSNILFSLKIHNLRQNNHFCLIMLLSFIIVPTLVAGAKSFTNVYCPYQLDIYNGFFPFVRVLESYPADFIQLKVGRCFPAGHSTAGFAFLGLFYAFQKKSYRYLGLTIGLLLGWTAGIYQMLRGQHFLSHTLFSMVAAFMLVILINQLVKKIMQKHPNLFTAS